MTLTAAGYRLAWQDGQISEHHLSLALAEPSHDWTPAQLLQFLDQPVASAHGLPLLEDMAKAEMLIIR